MWIASFTFFVYQWLPRSINLVSFHSGLYPVPLACSETAEFWVRASRIYLSCSFILSRMSSYLPNSHKTQRKYINMDNGTEIPRKPLRLNMRLKKRTVYLLALHLLVLDHVTKQVCISYMKNIHLTSLYLLFSTFHVVDPS